MARLPRVMGRGRALEVLLGADDITAANAELLGYVNRALSDAELDNFVDALATRIASFDKWAIANTKHLVNEASLPPDVEIRAGWDACGLREATGGAGKNQGPPGTAAPAARRPARSTRLPPGAAGPQRRALKPDRPTSLSEPGAACYFLLDFSGGRYSDAVLFWRISIGGRFPLTIQPDQGSGTGTVTSRRPNARLRAMQVSGSTTA
jgi:hypothetical protein